MLKTDRIGSTDGYCKVLLNSVWYQSHTISNSLNPVWNVTYELPLEKGHSPQMLKLRVKDWDSAGKNDLQGEAEIEVTRLEPEKRVELWADLAHPSLPQKGSVHVFVEYFPNQDIEAAAGL